MEQPPNVGYSWTIIVNWLNENCPGDLASLQGPASDEGLIAIERALREPLPADQQAWWRLADGTDEYGPAVWLIPAGWTPLSTRDALIRYNVMQNFIADEPELSRLSAEPAGSPSSGVWLPEWLPIAHNLGGDYLFLDLRSGPRNGCVGRHRKDEWNYDRPIWPSVTAMLSDVADALVNGTEIERRHAEIVDGRLDWLLQR
ncbi:SMI1/KNR4 family protein [Actinoplanes sp. NPDC051470]|uniref:SMI1/KNR4 family protein n=1 Tax=Actinoplanes sp. NPDC051470 TaxID=3157224 RepID=UPI0034333B97